MEGRKPVGPDDIQAIMLDLDGTLLTAQRTVSQRTVRALLALKERGLEIVVATGRMYDTASMFTRCLGITNPFVLGNGAVIAEPVEGKPLVEYLLEWDIARNIAVIAGNLDIHVQMFINGTLYYEVDDPVDRSTDVESFAKGKQVVFSRMQLPPVIKVMLVGDDHIADEVVTQINQLYPGELYIARSWTRYLEIMHPKANKGNGLLEVSRIMGIPASRFLAFGDGDNDKEMLENAGVGVAMGNASKTLKSVADHVTDSHNNDGIGKFLESYFKL